MEGIGARLADVIRRRAAAEGTSYGDAMGRPPEGSPWRREYDTALDEYLREQADTWKEPHVVTDGLMKNPWAIANAALRASPFTGGSRKDADALFAAVGLAQGVALRLEDQGRRRKLAVVSPERRETKKAQLLRDAGRHLRSPAWRRWVAVRDDWMSRRDRLTTVESRELIFFRLAPAFNALQLGVSMCVICAAFFVTGRKQKAETCNEKCAATVRQERSRTRAARRRRDALLRSHTPSPEDEHIAQLDLQRVTIRKKKRR